MFAAAVEKAHAYTMPIIVSERLANGKIGCGSGTFIVLNPDGWVLTAKHILDDLPKAQQHYRERMEYERRVAEIGGDGKLSPNQKRKMLKRLPMNYEWIVNYSLFWGLNRPDSSILKNISVDPARDLLTGKLEPFNADVVAHYPVFKNPRHKLRSGTSLCRLGFPFHKVSSTYDEKADQFILGPDVLPVPFFPNEGILTRAVVLRNKDGIQAKFIETSSPGLKGQSGGPIFDVEGNIWALQSRTMHLPLGFSPKVKEGSKEITEHQFMHVGWGIHVEDIIAFLDANGVQHQISA